MKKERKDVYLPEYFEFSKTNKRDICKKKKNKERYISEITHIYYFFKEVESIKLTIIVIVH